MGCLAGGLSPALAGSQVLGGFGVAGGEVQGLSSLEIGASIAPSPGIKVPGRERCLAGRVGPSSGPDQGPSGPGFRASREEPGDQELSGR